MADRDELIAAGMRAYKNMPGLNTESEGLNWLRVPMERVVDALLPLIQDE